MALVHAENLSNLSEWLDKIPPQTIEKKGKEWNLATPAERGELRSFKNLPRKVPNAAVIRNQWLTRNGSNFSGNTPAKKKVAGRVAALSDDKQKFNARPDYQNRRNPASSGSEVQP
jgi:hypothetical protein